MLPLRSRAAQQPMSSNQGCIRISCGPSIERWPAKCFSRMGRNDNRNQNETLSGVLFGVDRIKSFPIYALDVPSEAELGQGEDAIPVHIDFVPLDSMARRLRCIMMIVVPALTEGEKCNPKTVS